MTSTLILYNLQEVFEKYPNIQRRGWTKRHLKLWLEQDIIAGVLSEDLSQIRIEKDSIEDFITYHNDFLMKRIGKMEEGMRNLVDN